MTNKETLTDCQINQVSGASTSGKICPPSVNIPIWLDCFPDVRPPICGGPDWRATK